MSSEATVAVTDHLSQKRRRTRPRVKVKQLDLVATASPSSNRHPLQLVGVNKAAELTDESAWTWRERCYRGVVASVRTGSGKSGRLLIPLSEIERFVAEHTRPAIAL